MKQLSEIVYVYIFRIILGSGLQYKAYQQIKMPGDIQSNKSRLDLVTSIPQFHKECKLFNKVTLIIICISVKDLTWRKTICFRIDFSYWFIWALASKTRKYCTLSITSDGNQQNSSESNGVSLCHTFHLILLYRKQDG